MEARRETSTKLFGYSTVDSLLPSHVVGIASCIMFRIRSMGSLFKVVSSTSLLTLANPSSGTFDETWRAGKPSRSALSAIKRLFLRFRKLGFASHGPAFLLEDEKWVFRTPPGYNYLADGGGSRDGDEQLYLPLHISRSPHPLGANGSPLSELQYRRISPTEPVAILSAWVSRQSRKASFTASSLSIHM